MIPRILAAFLLTALSLSAQNTVVSPALWTNADSDGGNAFPFGSRAVPYRYLNVHDDMAGTARTIKAIGLRRSGTTSTTVIAAHMVTLDGFMSTAATTGSTMDATFDNNHGPDRQQVWTNRTFNFPAVGTGPLPYPFDYQLPLDVPFAFGGTGPLCWEVQITARQNPPSSLFNDYVSGKSSNPSMVVSRFGPACTATGRSTPFTLTGGSSTNWSMGTGEITATCSNGPANAMAAYLFGFTLFPVQVVLPGTQSGASGPCYALADLPFAVPGTLSSSGSHTFRLPVPLQPQFQGAQVYGQVAAADASANALGWVTSNGTDHQVVAPHGVPPGGRVYATSLGLTGTAGNDQTLVVQFTYQ